MARPRKSNADWFSHDTDMRNHRKVRALRTQFGLTGYAIFTMFLEVLADAQEFRIKYDDTELLLLAGDFGVALEDLREILNTMQTIGLVQVDTDGYLYNAHLLDRLEPMIAKRERMRKTYDDRQKKKTEQKPTIAQPKKSTTMTQEDFDLFWATYPNKTNKKKAQEKFMRIPKVKLRQILEAVEKQKQWRQWQEGFIPNATTWLNGERWDDILPPNTQNDARIRTSPGRAGHVSAGSAGSADFVL